MYRGRHRHEVGGRHGAHAARLARSSATPSTGPRELFYADIFASRKTAAARSSGCRACATSTPAASARTWSSTTCSTSCCSRCPTTTRTRTRTGPFAQVDSIAAADRQIERMMDAGGRARRVPRGPRGDRLLGPLAVAGGGRDRPVHARSTASACRRRPARAAGERDEIAVCPTRRARRRSTCSTATAAASWSRGSSAPLLALEGVDLVMRADRPPRRRGDRPRRARRGVARCASRPRGDLRRPRAASAGASRATSSCSASRSRDGALSLGDLPGRARARVWSALRCRTAGEVLRRPRPATSSSTGAARTTSAAARTARCTPTTRSATLLWCGTGPDSADAASSGRCATSCRWCSSTSASRAVGWLRGARSLLAAAPAAPPRRSPRPPTTRAPPPAGGWRRPTCSARSPRGPRCGARAASTS